ncbi:MAG: hypothetical protein EA398_07880 [Deltaproteobacteria bacterium]|nr:MAG: hypothetical protein EA398_07880 [Deltaproteobacteria bacterium]
MRLVPVLVLLTVAIAFPAACAAPETRRAQLTASDLQTPAERREVERFLRRSAATERPVERARRQLENGWIDHGFLEALEPRDIFREITLAPHADAESGENIGLQVEWLGHVARRLGPSGLVEGDVVLEVNRTSVLDPESLLATLEGLADADQVILTIVRAGQPLSLQAEVRRE